MYHNERGEGMDKLGPGWLYQKMLAFGITIDHHESDLYAVVSPVSQRLVDQYEYKENVTRFKSSDGRIWFDIPFAYTPYWNKKATA